MRNRPSMVSRFGYFGTEPHVAQSEPYTPIYVHVSYIFR